MQQERVEVPFANDGAKVLVVKFNDYQCPPCRQTYFAYEPILAKYKDRPKDVKYLLRHFPLDPQCNTACRSSCTRRPATRRPQRSWRDRKARSTS